MPTNQPPAEKRKIRLHFSVFQISWPHFQKTVAQFLSSRVEIYSTKFTNLSGLRRTRGIHFTQHRHCTGLLLRRDRSPSHGKNADKVNTTTFFFCKCQKCLFSELHAPGGNFILLAPPCFNFKYMGRNGKTRAWRMLQRAATLLPSLTLSFLDLNKCGR